MRADQLSKTLLEIKGIFSAAGLPAIEKDVATLAEYIGQQGDRDVDHVLAEIKAKLDPAAKPAVGSGQIAGHIEALKNAGLDEARFRSALGSLRADKALDKQDVLQVLQGFGVIRINGKSRDAYLESLDKHFYWLLYNRDADAMAERATPW